MQIKTTVRYPLTLVRMAIIKKQQQQQQNPQTNAGESMKRREHSCTVCGNVNWYSHYGEQYGGSFKN